MAARLFYGWRMVGACLAIATIAWSFGLFGTSVYLQAIAASRGWSIGLISSSITVCFVLGALSLSWVGSAVQRLGPRPVFATGAVLMTIAVAGLGLVRAPWQVYLPFAVLGVGWGCLTTTAIAATLAPWFERHQGRAVSTALLGASVGAMVGTPYLIAVIRWFGFDAAMLGSAFLLLVLLLPLVWILRHRPQEMGLLPDGDAGTAPAVATPAHWTRAAALRTMALRSTIVAFGIGLMMQVGLITHHVGLLLPTLGAAGAAATITGTGLTAFVGRVALARFADRIDMRISGAAVLTLAATCLAALGLFPVPAVLVGASLLYGIGLGNVTTLSPLIVRREFGAESFGPIYGVASMAIQLIAALGPGFYGLLHDAFGGYSVPLVLAALLDVAAAALVLIGAPRNQLSPAT